MSELYKDYTDSEIQPKLPVSTFTRLFQRIFKGVTKRPVSQQQIRQRGANRYYGVAKICWLEHDYALLDLSTQPLPDEAMLLSSRAPSSIMFAVQSGVISNDNIVLKIVWIADRKWGMKICGKEIKLEHYDIDNRIEYSPTVLLTIYTIARALPLCSGIAEEKLSARLLKSYGSREEISSVSDDGDISTQMKIRSPNCLRVIKLLATNFDSGCPNCRRDLRNPQNMEESSDDEAASDAAEDNAGDAEEDDAPENNEESDEQIAALIDKLFPGTTRELKVLLLDQRLALKATSPSERQWSKEVLIFSLNIFKQNPEVYNFFSDSKILILPSTDLLEKDSATLIQEARQESVVFTTDTAKEKSDQNAANNNCGDDDDDDEKNEEEDFDELIEKLLPGANDEMKAFFSDQKQSATNNRGRRWKKETIIFALNVFQQSKAIYNYIKDSKLMLLPSYRRIITYMKMFSV